MNEVHEIKYIRYLGEAWNVIIKIINKNRQLTCPRKCSKDFTCITPGIGICMIFTSPMRKLRNREVNYFDKGYTAKNWKNQIWLFAKLPVSLGTQWLVATVIAFGKNKQTKIFLWIHHRVVLLKSQFWFLFGRWHNLGYI